MIARDFGELGLRCISLMVSGVNAVFRSSNLFFASTSDIEGEVLDFVVGDRGVWGERSGALGEEDQFGPAFSNVFIRSGVSAC
ncbi:hypothetical protein PflCFBP13517_24370 [Pseudomonas fluorescens]|nr:hypothetical protein PD374_14770 [Pseudomonas sp. WCS374]TKK38325.1 hypothetical protein PflCFBP13517_24370 [Pseudomonas fluorescens]